MASKNDEYRDVAGLGARIANLQTKDGFTLGIETHDGILDIDATAQKLGLPVPKDMDDLLQRGLGRYIPPIVKQASQQRDSAVFIDSSDLSFAPLVTRPENIVCVGFNYREHVIEAGAQVPEKPQLFNKYCNALNHHNGIVNLPTDLDYRFDYETELVLIFSRECKDVTEADAMDYVAGYAVGNDVSARTLQTIPSQFRLGKSSDGFGPVGPWLVPRDRVADPNNLRIQTHVNGQKRQDRRTNDLIFKFGTLIAYISSIMTIKPGDILFTGTPQGVILGEKAPPHQRRWLQPGDEVVSEIEGMGQLRIQLRGPQGQTAPKPDPNTPRKLSTVDRLAVLNGGEVYMTDRFQSSLSANPEQPTKWSNNVYLIQHGASYLLWDTGLPDTLLSNPSSEAITPSVNGTLKESLLSQLHSLSIDPDKITHIAFSNPHPAHVGNSAYFSSARWYVPAATFAAMFPPEAAVTHGFVPSLYASMKDNSVVVTGEKYDVFGDGSLTIFETPGHQSLLVRLPEKGPVLLSGDVPSSGQITCGSGGVGLDMEVGEKEMVERIVKEEGAELWRTHDWEQSRRIRHAPEWIW